MRRQVVSGRQAALCILHAWFGPLATEDAEAHALAGHDEKPAQPGSRTTRTSRITLAGFQQQAADRLRSILRSRGGALLADAVGMGKTYVALSLIEDALQRGAPVLIVIPAALRAHWLRHLRRLPAGMRDTPRLVTHTALSFGRLPAGFGQPEMVTGGEPPQASPGRPSPLIVVDEAHAFRNHRTRRYETLSRLTGGARVLLLSATPINNSLADLYHLIRLFAQDHDFHDLGIADLRETFARGVHDPLARRAVQRVLEDVVVRRTRSAVALPHVARRAEPAPPGFAQRKPPRAIRYDLVATYGPSWPDLYLALQQLTFAAATVMDHGSAAELMLLHLLKRLESSTAAFALSLNRQEQLCALMINALQNGRWIAPTALRSLIHDGDFGTQLAAEQLLSSPLPRDLDVSTLLAALEADRCCFRRCRRALPDPGTVDPKLAALQQLLHELGPGVIVFTQYRDTALYLWSRLHRDLRIGLVHGTEARLGARRAARSTVIDCFAPHANGARPPAERMRVDVLITTDVLAEGMNLQDAHTVVSYDIPWNPVTLMQRFGRIDRLGSPHPSVQLCNFLPDRGLEDWLRLIERVESKLDVIQRTVGQDGAVLELASTTPATSINRATVDAPLAAYDLVETLRTRWQHQREFRAPQGAVVACVAADRDGWLMAAHDGTRLRLCLVNHAGQIGEDLADAARVLQSALDQQDVNVVAEVPPWARVREWLTAERATGPPMSRRQPELRTATRRLLRIAAGEEVSARQLRRANRLLERLARPLPTQVAARLGLVLGAVGPDQPAAVLLEALEVALGESRALQSARHGSVSAVSASPAGARPVACFRAIAALRLINTDQTL